jgi:hypothetical protein
MLDGLPSGWQTDRMETTIELPEAVLNRVKIRAERAGHKLKDTIAELVLQGLDAEDSGGELHMGKHRGTGFPIFLSSRAANPDQEMTPERISELLTEDETNNAHATR